MTIELVCTYCGAEWHLEGRPAELQQQVAIDVGHVMPTLEMAIAHLICDRCDRTRLQRATDPPSCAPTGS